MGIKATQNRDGPERDKNGWRKECLALFQKRFGNSCPNPASVQKLVYELSRAFAGSYRSAEDDKSGGSPLFSFSTAQSRSLVFKERMAPRQRLLSRRGSGRGGTSHPQLVYLPPHPMDVDQPPRPLVNNPPPRPLDDIPPPRPVVDDLPPRPLVNNLPPRPLDNSLPPRPLVDYPPPPGLSSCYCNGLCHQAVGAHPIRPSHFLDTRPPDSNSAPLPAFGTAVFTVFCGQCHSSINAHVSVLFMEEPKEEVGGLPSAQIHHAECSRVAEERAETQPEPNVVQPSSQPAPASGKAKVDWGPPPEGEYWIYEEDSEEEDSVE